MNRICVIFIFLFGLYSFAFTAEPVETEESLADAVALKILQSAISKNMGSAEAVALNSALTAFASAGESGLKSEAASHANSMIDKYVTGSREQKNLKEVINKWQNGRLSQSDISAGVKSLGTSALKNAIAQNVGKSEAALLNNAIDKYVNSGISGVADVGQEELKRLIGKYIKGESAQKALNEAVKKIRNNDLASIDIGNVGREITRGALENWVDKQGWSASEKEAAKKIISGTLDNGVDGLTDAVVESIQKKISKEIGGEAGKAVGNLLNDMLDGKNITGERIKEDAGTIVQSAAIDAINKQFEKLAKKYPIIAKLLDKLGIKDDILNAATNIKGIIANANNLKDLVLGLANLTVETLNGIMNKLASFGKAVIESILNQLGKIMESILNAVVDLLVKFASEMVNELLEYAKQIAQMVTELSNKAFYIINDAKDNINTVIDASKELVAPGKAALEIK